MSKIVHSFPKTINFSEIQIFVWWGHNDAAMECDDFVFLRKVN